MYAVIGNLADGLAASLQGAGLTGIQITGALPDQDSIEALHAGTNAWWLLQDDTMAGWLSVDAVLRAEETAKAVNENDLPLSILTPQNTAKNLTQPPSYPTDFRQLFEKLWHVG